VEGWGSSKTVNLRPNIKKKRERGHRKKPEKIGHVSKHQGNERGKKHGQDLKIADETYRSLAALGTRRKRKAEEKKEKCGNKREKKQKTASPMRGVKRRMKKKKTTQGRSG